MRMREIWRKTDNWFGFGKGKKIRKRRKKKQKKGKRENKEVKNPGQSYVLEIPDYWKNSKWGSSQVRYGYGTTILRDHWLSNWEDYHRGNGIYVEGASARWRESIFFPFPYHPFPCPPNPAKDRSPSLLPRGGLSAIRENIDDPAHLRHHLLLAVVPYPHTYVESNTDSRDKESLRNCYS